MRCQTSHCSDPITRIPECPHPDSWLAPLSSVWVTPMKAVPWDRTCTFQWSWVQHITVLYADLEILQRKASALKNTASESRTEPAFKLVVRKPPKSGATLFLETNLKSRLLKKNSVKEKHQYYYIRTYFSKLTLKTTHLQQHKQTDSTQLQLWGNVHVTFLFMPL